MPLAVVDLDRSPASRGLVERFLTTDEFASAGRPGSTEQATEWLQSGRARVVLVIPENFQRDIERGETATLQVLLDGTNSNVAAQARSYTLQSIGRFQATRAASVKMVPVGVEPVLRIWYNPDQSYTAFMVLSMIALAALMVGVIQPAASIVRER